jgi:hypothetical protein
MTDYAVALCAVAAWMLVPMPARAGVELTTEISNPSAPVDKQPKATRSGRMLLDGERVRMELDGAAAGEPKHVMIYRGDRDLVWSLDDKHRTYTEVDRARMQEMRGQSESARAKMRAELAKLPPAEQARMQAALAASDPASTQRAAPTVKETGRVDTIGGLKCHDVEVSRGGVKESEICVVDWKTAGVTKADLAPVRQLGTFQQETFGGPTRRDSDDMLALFDGLDGLPVRVRSFRGGQVRSEFRVVKVEHKALDAKLFEPPDGYQKRVFSISMPGVRTQQGGAGQGVPPPNAAPGH